MGFTGFGGCVWGSEGKGKATENFSWAAFWVPLPELRVTGGEVFWSGVRRVSGLWDMFRWRLCTRTCLVGRCGRARLGRRCRFTLRRVWVLQPCSSRAVGRLRHVQAEKEARGIEMFSDAEEGKGGC